MCLEVPTGEEQSGAAEHSGEKSKVEPEKTKNATDNSLKVSGSKNNSKGRSSTPKPTEDKSSKEESAKVASMQQQMAAMQSMLAKLVEKKQELEPEPLKNKKVAVVEHSDDDTISQNSLDQSTESVDFESAEQPAFLRQEEMIIPDSRACDMPRKIWLQENQQGERSVKTAASSKQRPKQQSCKRRYDSGPTAGPSRPVAGFSSTKRYKMVGCAAVRDARVSVVIFKRYLQISLV